MAKVRCRWKGPDVDVPSLDRTIRAGDEFEMELSEAEDRADDVEIITDKEDE